MIRKTFIMGLFISTLILIYLSSSTYGIDTILKVALVPKLPPYQFIYDGEYRGMHIDILNEIANNNNYIIEYVPMETTSECLKALNRGDIDIVLGIPSKNGLAYKVKQTDDISQSTICMIATSNKAKQIRDKIDMMRYKTVYEKGSIDFSFMQNTGARIYIVLSNQERVFEFMISNPSIIAVGVKDSLIYQLERRNMEDLYTVVYNYMDDIRYTMAVNQGDEDLLYKLNKGIENLRINGRYEMMLNNWIVDESKYAIKEIIRKTAYFSVIIFSLVGIIIIFNLRLKKQVYEKTKELQYQIIETKNNNELRNSIVENDPNGIIVFDINYKITLFNQSAVNIMNDENLEMGESIFEIELINKIFINKKEDIFESNKPVINQEISFENFDIGKKIYRYSIYMLYDYKEDIRGAILTINDVTEDMLMKEEVFQKEKNRVLNQLIAGIAHEIRNPLMSIKTFAELIPIRKDNERFQQLFFEHVPREVERANALIENLIDYSKPKRGNKEIVYVRDIIDSCIALINPVMENENVKLNLEIQDDLRININKSQLKQILINIIINGFQSIQEKMNSCKNNETNEFNMFIDAWNDENDVIIQIIDEGVGMTPDELKRSTEPFFTTKSNGTGLGLSICKQYMEDNNDLISIESEKGKFTKIILRFRR